MISGTRLKKPVLIIQFFFLLCFSLYGEKWVGQCATYQLLEGTKTESGEAFDRASYSAACNGFRLGSEIDVINVKNGKSVTVKVNNRITSESKYFILLTPQAARDIEMEWETGLVVINADFSDVNSTEILPINGLVSEGTFDEETVKKFPSIKWPSDKGEDIIEQGETETLEDPLFAEEKYPDRKEEKVVLIDGGGPLIKGEKEKTVIDEKDTLDVYPDDEVLKYPDKIMEAFALDTDTVIVLENGKQLEPAVEKLVTPYKKVMVSNLDEDILERYTPELESYRKPQPKYALLDGDSIGNPLEEFVKTPDLVRVLLDSDYESLPDVDKVVFPKKEYIFLLGPDRTDRIDGPETELIKVPDQIDRLLDSDLELLPDEEKKKYPERDLAYLGDDSELEVSLVDENPHVEEVKTPLYVPTQFDNDREIMPDVEKVKVPERDYYAALSDDELVKIIEKIEKDPREEEAKIPSYLYARLSADGDVVIIEDPREEGIKNPSYLYARLSADGDIKREDEGEKEYPADEKGQIPRDKESRLSRDYDVEKMDDQERTIRDEQIEEKDLERTIRDERVEEKDQERTIRDERVEEKDQERTIRDEEYVEGEANWKKSLQKGKLYIRLYTSFDKAEASSKLVALGDLLPGIVGMAQDGKYIIFYGPVKSGQASSALDGIRSYGFRDAYIVRIK